MRVFTLCVVLLFSALALGQTAKSYAGSWSYGCGPYVPLVTTPSISLQTVSPNPVGATNATTGLVAGATNSTLSMVSGNTSAVYTEPVWYSGGGAPLIAPAVLVSLPRVRTEHEQQQAPRGQPHAAWVFFSAAEVASTAEIAVGARGGPRAMRTYTNRDIQQLKPPDNTVKYEGKTQRL